MPAWTVCTEKLLASMYATRPLVGLAIQTTCPVATGDRKALSTFISGGRLGVPDAAPLPVLLPPLDAPLLLPPPAPTDALPEGESAAAKPSPLFELQLLVARTAAAASDQTASQGGRALTGPSRHAFRLRETVFSAGISESLPLPRSG